MGSESLEERAVAVPEGKPVNSGRSLSSEHFSSGNWRVLVMDEWQLFIQGKEAWKRTGNWMEVMKTEYTEAVEGIVTTAYWIWKLFTLSDALRLRCVSRISLKIFKKVDLSFTNSASGSNLPITRHKNMFLLTVRRHSLTSTHYFSATLMRFERNDGPPEWRKREKEMLFLLWAETFGRHEGWNETKQREKRENNNNDRYILRGDFCEDKLITPQRPLRTSAQNNSNPRNSENSKR